MTLHASQSLAAFSAFASCPIFSHFVSPSNIFSCCFPLLHFPLIIQVVFQFHHMAKKVVWHLHIQFMNDLVLAPHSTVSFDFFAVHEICSILLRNHISVAFIFFVAVLKLSRLCMRTSGWLYYNSPDLKKKTIIREHDVKGCKSSHIILYYIISYCIIFTDEQHYSKIF